MKYILTALVVAALLVPATALAGGNPEAKVFISFVDPVDNSTISSRIDPESFTAFTAYIGVTDLGQGTTGASFALSVTPGMSSPPSFTNLLPGDLAIGNWETGLTLASTECMNADDHPGDRLYIDPVVMGTLSLFYLGTPGDILWVDHPEYPRWVTDCNNPAEVDFYCVYSNGGVGKDAVAGDVGCDANTPVEDATWSSIKALYR